MKNNQLKNSFLMPIFVLVNIFSTLAFGQNLLEPKPNGHFTDNNGNLVFNLNECKEIPCKLRYKFATVEVTSGRLMRTESGINKVYSDENSSFIKIQSDQSIISANVFAIEKVLKSHSKYNDKFRVAFAYCSSVSQTKSPYLNENRNLDTTNDDTTTKRIEVSQIAGCIGSIAVNYVVIDGRLEVPTDSAVEEMDLSSLPLISMLTAANQNLVKFKQILPKDSSDLRHLNRLEKQIAIAIKTMNGESGKPLLPITHRKITENLRMIMVLSTVLEEITDRYDFDTDLLRPLYTSKLVLNKLSRQIRKMYGWDEGLAGSGSKALAALGTVLDSELRSLYSISAAFNNDAKTAQAFNALFRANSILVAKVNASNSGDIAGTDAAKEVIKQWNSTAFQSILQILLNAPKDAQPQVQNRILMALTAIESIKDYVDPKGDLKSSIDVPTSVRSKLK